MILSLSLHLTHNFFYRTTQLLSIGAVDHLFFLKEEMGSSRTLIAYSKSQACNYEMFNLFSFIFIFSSNSRDDNLKIFLFLFFLFFFLEFLAVISHKTVIHTLILNEVNFFIHLLAFFFLFCFCFIDYFKRELAHERSDYCSRYFYPSTAVND